MCKLVICLMIVGIVFGAQSAKAESMPTHCANDEVTLFACPIKKKVVSYCAGPQKPPYTYIEYRYGVPGKVEKTYRADGTAKKQFHVDVTWLRPIMLIQLGFSDGGHNYTLDTCSGGMCSEEDRPKLLVMKGDKEIARLQCGAVEPEDDPLGRFPFTIESKSVTKDDFTYEVPVVVTTSKLITPAR